MKSQGLISRVLALLMGCLICYQIGLTLYYPRKPYVKEIAFASVEFSIDANLIRAVIHTESRFDPFAVSAAGAEGLMQLMPDTARFCAGILRLETRGPISELLKDPAANIRLGSFYLSYLLRKFDCEKDALAAYNAGEGNVRAWQMQGLTQIPFPETRAYVRRVERAKSFYQKNGVK